MLTEALTALAAAGGSALVGAVATDAWRTAKAGFSHLLGRGDAGRTAAVERQLEASRAQLEAADGADEQVRLVQQAAWTARLEDLLIEQPHAADALRQLLQQVSHVGVSTAGHLARGPGGFVPAQPGGQGHGGQRELVGAPAKGAA